MNESKESISEKSSLNTSSLSSDSSSIDSSNEISSSSQTNTDTLIKNLKNMKVDKDLFSREDPLDFKNMTKSNMIDFLEQLVDETNIRNKKFQEFLSFKNKIEEKELEKFSSEYKDVYPNLLDPLFNIKILQKQEFNDLIYNKEIEDVTKEGNRLCNSEFELSLHQKFVRNYLSFLTPYNNLLLYHGLGTGKTCSAISVCEEMRKYMKQLGTKNKILIVASPNVQENFKLQLFDERKLKQINGIWSLKGCTGNNFLKEINPTNIKGLKKEVIVKLIKKIIKQYYEFMGYEMFSNYISKIKKNIVQTSNESINVKRKINAIKKHFNNRLLVIDEVHNIRSGGSGINKELEQNFLDIVRITENLKLLFLSATPMFNSYKEIIWLINLMNLNDKRPQIKVSDIFDKLGNLKEEGEELLLRKSRGYISYIRGENPYSFPYRIYPSMFNINRTLFSSEFSYPSRQINKMPINEPMKMIDIYLTNTISEYQKVVYEKSLENIIGDFEELRNIEEEYGLGWQKIDKPLQTLNMVYPNSLIDNYIEDKSKDFNIKNVIGSEGLNSIMDYNKNKTDYEYKDEVLEKYGRIFSLENLNKYSHKISNIVENIKKSNGVVLIYSQYIDGGCIPLALALEELGITRYGSRSSLFSKKPVENVDYETFKSKEETLKIKSSFNPAKYVMITGDIKLSPKNVNEVIAATSEDNINGEKVKVIIISKAGSEGIDFKFIRQIHILEPWYNMSRTEQIIGRGVRFCSHKQLPYVDRNVEIYLYCTNPYNEYEPIDMYVYRNAEYKAIQIGKVSRLLKKNAVDCLLNIKYNSLTIENINQTVKQNLSNGLTIDYDVGDKPYSQLCDYMEKCDYKCYPENIDISFDDVNNTTYDEDYILFNIEILINKIKDLFKEEYILSKDELIIKLKEYKSYPLLQIDYALNILINDNNEFIKDNLNRDGKLVNIGEYYMFQPIELNNKFISNFERMYPIDYKVGEYKIKLPESINEDILKNIDEELEEKKEESDEDILKIKSIKKISSTKYINSVITQYINDLYDYYKLIDEIKVSKIWYENIGFIKTILTNDYYKGTTSYPLENISKYVIEHIVDSIPYDKLKNVIVYLYNDKSNNFKASDDEFTKFKYEMYNYIDNIYKLKGPEHNGFILIDKKVKELFILKENKKYYLEKVETKTDKEFIKQLELYNLLESYNKLKYDISELNNVFGFMSYIEKINKQVLKVKNMTLKRNTGLRIDQANKNKLAEVFDDLFTEVNKNNLFSEEQKKKVKLIHINIILELLLRYYQDINKNNKIWYMPYNISVINNVEKLYKET